MGQFIKEMFSETGDISMVRVLSFVCVMTATFIALRAVAMDRDLNAASILCGVFLGAGLGAKVTQKVIEAKNVDGN